MFYRSFISLEVHCCQFDLVIDCSFSSRTL